MRKLQSFKQPNLLQKVKRKISHLDSLDLVKYGYPVDFQDCHNHRKAHLINKSIVNGLDERVVCQCCGRTVGSQPQTSLCYDNNIFAKYGPGIPLYFQFFKFVIYLLVLYFCVYGIYGILSNFMSNDCKKYRHCWKENFGMNLSFLNSYQEQHVTFFQLGLIVFVIGLSIFFFLFIRYKLKQEKQQFDDFLISPSDFSIILRRLPKSTTQKDIQKTIDNFRYNLSDQQKIETNNLKIHNIIFAYNLTEYLQVQKKNQQNFKQSCMNDSIFTKISPPNINQKLSTAVVIFQKQSSKQFFTGYLSCFEQFKRSHWLGHQPFSSLVQVRGEYVNVERAPQPDDIIWENQGLNVRQLQIRRLLVLSFSVGMLTVSAGLQYRLAKWRMTFSLKDETTQRLFSLGLACFITIINQLITTLLVFSTKFEKPRTYTLQKISLIFKIVLMQFLNSGIISILIIATLQNSKFYKTCICIDILYIMVMNMVVNNIINFLMVTLEIPSWLDRVLLYFRVETYTQKEANKIFEANEVGLQNKYAYIFKTLWLTAFFMPTQPIVVLLSILALLINYWSQKYLFSGFYSIPYMFSGRISILVLDLLNYTCLWLVLGSLFIHLVRVNFHLRLMSTQYIVFHGIGLILSIVIIFSPLSHLSKNIFGETETQNQYHHSYQVEKKHFQITYQASNPAYRKGRKFKRKFHSLCQRLSEALQ